MKINGVNIPSPATINQIRMVSQRVALLRNGIKYFVKQTINIAAGI